MGTANTSGRQPRQIEDPLEHLPHSLITEYRKGDSVYSPQVPPSGLHLVIDGKVKVCRVTGNGRQVVVDIYQPDDFFGECAFVDGARHPEIAVAIEETRVMCWSVAEIEDLAGRKPALAIALVQLLVQRSLEFGARIESLSTDSIAQRLARALLRFSDRLGHPDGDGGMRMIPFTHELLSQYVGTSREIVTQYMNRFRRSGLLQYSRKGIQLNIAATRAWLDSGDAS